MKYYKIIPIIFLVSFSHLFTDEITLDECIKSSLEQNPIKQQKILYQTISMLEQRNYSSIYLPQFKIEGSANYQSDVFELPIKLPTVSIPGVDKFQYQASLNLYQTIYEGGFASNSKEVSTLDKDANLKNIEVTNQKIKETVTELYFAVMQFQENINSLRIMVQNLYEKLKQVQSFVNNGVTLKKDIELFNIEILKAEQRINSLESDKKSVIMMLSKWTGKENIISSQFSTPPNMPVLIDFAMNRPELELLKIKQESILKRKDVAYAQILPQISGFAKAGYGSPNPFNMFQSELSIFYMLGVKFQWSIYDWASNENTRQILDNNKEILNVEYTNLNRNLSILVVKDLNDITKFDDLIQKDEQIYKIQENVIKTVFSQYSNGTATSTDYINEQNNLTNYDINLKLHKIQKVQATYNYLIKTGNYK